MFMTYLHLNDSQQQPPQGSLNYDRQYKLRPLLYMIVKSCQSVYTPKQHVSVDEAMINFKGRLSWIQYMPKKPIKWGIKAWVLTDSLTGYVWNFKLYTGKITVHLIVLTINRTALNFLNVGKENDSSPQNGLAHNVVLSLVSGLELKGYHAYTDNFYSSPALFVDLHNKGFEATGTVRMNRRGIPKSIQDRKLQKGKQQYNNNK